MSRKSLAVAALALTLVFTTGIKAALAAPTPDLTQTISAGSLVTDIRDATRNPVASPTFALSSLAYSFSCQFGGGASTGTLGSDSQRIYAENPGASDTGWTIDMAATGGATAVWDDGATFNYDFNDPTGANAGCTDGADADSKAGQLTVDPSASTLVADCTSCATTAITKGAPTGFSEGTADSINLLNAAAGSDDNGRWYLTGVGLSQTIPAEQEVANYSMNFTVTITAQ